MKTKTRALMIVTALSALLGAAFLAGCTNGSASAAETDLPSDAGEIVTEPAMQAEENAARAAWEAELARREQEIDRLEERLAETVRELETRERELPVVEIAPELPRVEDEPEVQPQPPAAATPAEDEEPEPAPETVWVTVNETEPLPIEFLVAVSSETSLAGDPLRARLAADVIRQGLIALPAGSELRGSVVEAVATRKIGGQARLILQFDQIVLPSGDDRAIDASLELLGKKQTARDAGTISGSAAGGALLGRILAGDDDRDKGTVIGAVLGAAVGTAVASKNANIPVTVEAGQIAELFLATPLELAVLAPAAEPAFARNSP